MRDYVSISHDFSKLSDVENMTDSAIRLVSLGYLDTCNPPPLCLTSDQTRIPTELKHINKWRKRNQQGLP